MRQAVLDVGSNTAHLLVVDFRPGAAPIPASSTKEPLRLAEQITPGGALSDAGVESLIAFVRVAQEKAEDLGCEEIWAFATSAIRDATNSAEVLEHVGRQTGVEIGVLSGEDEARLTFLAVRRWFGWSAGRIALFDIGGGSLEVAVGADEYPDVAMSYELGAGRLTRDWLRGDVPDYADVKKLRKHARRTIADDAVEVTRGAGIDHWIASSKTFRSLARVCGAAPSSDGPFVPRRIPRSDLKTWLPKLAAMTTSERAGLPGVSASRAHQLVAGAVVAEAVMDLFEIDFLEMCPWALREGALLQKLDRFWTWNVR